MSESKTTPLAPLPAYLIDIIEVIFLILGCLFGIVAILRLISCCYTNFEEIKFKKRKVGDEEIPCVNATGRAALSADGNVEKHEELKHTEEKNDKHGNQ